MINDKEIRRLMARTGNIGTPLGDAIEALMRERDDARGFNNKTFEVLMSRLHSIKESLEYYAARAKRAEAALRTFAEVKYSEGDLDQDEVGVEVQHLRRARAVLAQIEKD